MCCVRRGRSLGLQLAEVGDLVLRPSHAARLPELPRNASIHWHLQVHSQDALQTRYVSSHPMFGAASLRVQFHANVESMHFGSVSAEGIHAFCCLQNPATECQVFYGLSDFPLMPLSNHSPGPQQASHASRHICITWSSAGFRVRIDGLVYKRAQYFREIGHIAPPDCSLVFVSLRLRSRQGEGQTTHVEACPSAVRRGCSLTCAVCHRRQDLRQNSWEQCIICSAWICHEHPDRAICEQCRWDREGGSTFFLRVSSKHLRAAGALQPFSSSGKALSISCHPVLAAAAGQGPPLHLLVLPFHLLSAGVASVPNFNQKLTAFERAESVADQRGGAAQGHVPTQALFVKPQWCRAIFLLGKTWEIRGKATSKRGRVCIAEAGAKRLVGEVNIVASLHVGTRDAAGVWRPVGATSEALGLFFQNPSNASKHCIADFSITRRYKNAYAWVLADVVSYGHPVCWQPPRGPVVFANLGNDVHLPEVARPSVPPSSELRQLRKRTANRADSEVSKCRVTEEVLGRRRCASLSREDAEMHEGARLSSAVDGQADSSDFPDCRDQCGGSWPDPFTVSDVVLPLCLRYTASCPELGFLQAACRSLRCLILTESTWAGVHVDAAFPKRTPFARKFLSAARLSASICVAPHDMLRVASEDGGVSVQWPAATAFRVLPQPAAHFRTQSVLCGSATLQISMPRHVSVLVLGLKPSPMPLVLPEPCWVQISNPFQEGMTISSGQEDRAASGIWPVVPGTIAAESFQVQMQWCNSGLSVFIDGFPFINVSRLRIALWSYVYLHCIGDAVTPVTFQVALMPSRVDELSLPPPCQACAEAAVSCCPRCHAWRCTIHHGRSSGLCSRCHVLLSNQAVDRRGGSSVTSALPLDAWQLIISNIIWAGTLAAVRCCSTDQDRLVLAPATWKGATLDISKCTRASVQALWRMLAVWGDVKPFLVAYKHLHLCLPHNQHLQYRWPFQTVLLEPGVVGLAAAVNLLGAASVRFTALSSLQEVWVGAISRGSGGFRALAWFHLRCQMHVGTVSFHGSDTNYDLSRVQTLRVPELCAGTLASHVLTLTWQEFAMEVQLDGLPLLRVSDFLPRLLPNAFGKPFLVLKFAARAASTERLRLESLPADVPTHARVVCSACREARNPRIYRMLICDTCCQWMCYFHTHCLACSTDYLGGAESECSFERQLEEELESELEERQQAVAVKRQNSETVEPSKDSKRQRAGFKPRSAFFGVGLQRLLEVNHEHLTAGMVPDVLADHDGNILHELEEFRSLVAEFCVGSRWTPQLQNILVGALAVRRLRLRDVSRRKKAFSWSSWKEAGAAYVRIMGNASSFLKLDIGLSTTVSYLKVH